MKRLIRVLSMLGTMAALVLLLGSCASEPEGAGSDEVASTADASNETKTSASAGDASEGSILDVMEADPRLSLARDAYIQNGYDLDLGLAPGPPMAVLAPSNAAFEAWLEMEGLTYDEFLEVDPEGAHETLGGHLLPGGLEDTSGEVDLPTLTEEIWVRLIVDDDGISIVSDPQAEVIDRIEADNGVIFVLDTFLVPGGSGGDDGAGATSGGPLEPGSPTQGEAVLAEEFALPVSIATESEWFAAVVQPGAVILEYPERETQFTRAVLILSAEPLGGGDVDDWGDQQDGVSVEDRQETQVSGFDTVVYDLSYDGDGELPFLSAQCCGGQIILRSSEYYRVWVIDIDADKPLVVFSPVLRGDLDWYENAQGIVDSMQIG